MEITLDKKKVSLTREIPNKEIKDISKALNKAHGTKLKIVAISTVNMVEAYILAVEKLDDEGKVQIKKKFSDYYTGLFPKEEKKKSAEKKKTAAKKSAAPKKDKPAKGPGVLASILEFIQKGPITKEKILKQLEKRFPDRESEAMAKTINAQIGGKKSPCRMEKERKVKFVISDKGAYSIK